MTGEPVDTERGDGVEGLPVAPVLARCPVAVLIGTADRDPGTGE